MAEDLLTRIQQELQERMHRLRPAVEERDRLRADLQALDAVPEPPAAPNVDPEPSADLEPSAAVLSFPARRVPVRREPARTRALSPQAARLMPTPPHRARADMVSPKVLRLMLAPRRPALERAGIPRVSARTDR